MVDIKSMTIDQLEQFVMEIGEKKFHAGQLFEWMHGKRAVSFEEMTNLSKNFRGQLEKQAFLTVLKKAAVQVSKQDGTRKYLFRLNDGNMIESVCMKYHHGNSVCISSQAGCRMGCTFCASAIGGLVRNLTAAEMAEQVYRISEDVGERISNIVIMGTGEPLDNYENLLQFLRIINDKKGANISHRNITVSTCGLVPQIRRLAEEKLQITLALSLHAPVQEKRESLMPVAKTWPLPEVMEACREYFEKTGRRISFEYSLIHGKNDTIEDSQALIELTKGLNCHINLIPVNPVKDTSYRQPDRTHVQKFKNMLEKSERNVTIRREMGRDIDGACGQLRQRYMKTGEKTDFLKQKQNLFGEWSGT